MSTVRHVSESALQRAVGAEASARANAVSAETRRAKSAEDSLSDALGNKVDKVAGKGLSESNFTPAEKTKLEGIETGAQVNPLPIGPSAATEEGKFADAKLTFDLINEVASTNSAHYLTADADGTPFATAANLRSALASHTEADPKFFYAGAAFTPTKNDWVVVQSDEEHPLGTIVPSSRWGFVGVFGGGGSFQYQVSYRLPLTPEQIAAMNSGATAQKIARYDGHYSSQNNPHNVTTEQIGAAKSTALAEHVDNDNVHVTQQEKELLSGIDERIEDLKDKIKDEDDLIQADRTYKHTTRTKIPLSTGHGRWIVDGQVFEASDEWIWGDPSNGNGVDRESSGWWYTYGGHRDPKYIKLDPLPSNVENEFTRTDGQKTIHVRYDCDYEETVSTDKLALVSQLAGKITNPSGGAVGNVLKKTPDGVEWGEGGGGGGGGEDEKMQAVFVALARMDAFTATSEESDPLDVAITKLSQLLGEDIAA